MTAGSSGFAMPKSTSLIVPSGRREDVARLEIAVHDQAPVGRGDRLADMTEDPKARGDVQLVVVAVAIDPHARPRTPS